MNVYQKLQRCRKELKALPIKESGNNSFAGYRYMELADFLPHIIELCDKHNLCTVITFDEIATLTVINSDKPDESIIFTSPIADAQLKGCHPVQNLGAVQTYLRRYLYVTAFDVSEHDALDSTHGKEEKKEEKKRQPSGLSPLEALRKELSDYCKGDDAEMSILLAAATKFEKDGKESWMDYKKLDTYDAKWCGAALGKVRKYIDERMGQ